MMRRATMLKIMQIGYGYWGNNVAKKLLMSKKFLLTYLIETDPEKAKNAHIQLPEVIVDSDYRIHLNEVDAVAICTQTEFSFDIAMAAMNARKHVFIEKPLAKDMAHAIKLVNKADCEGIVLHCDHLMVYNPIIRTIKRMIQEGELGEIMYIDISRINLGPIRKDINALLDLAVHDIAVVDYLLDGLAPENLHAVGTKFHGKQETITYLTMKNKNTLISINSSWISPVKLRKTVVAGTKKMLIFDDLKENKLQIYDCGIDVVQGDVYGEYEYRSRVGDVYLPHIDFEDSLLNSLEFFADCINTGKKSLSGPDECLRVMKVLEDAQYKMHDMQEMRKKEID